MGDTGRESLFGNVVRGAVAGGVATWLMDLVTTGLQEQQTPADAAREKAAQLDGKSSVAHLVDLVERETGFQVGDDLRPNVEMAVHYGLGVIPGAVYGATRRWIPGLGAGRGLVYGLLVFLLNDELLNTVLGLSARPDAYPLSTHLRGVVGHLALGAATDFLIDVTGG